MPLILLFYHTMVMLFLLSLSCYLLSVVVLFNSLSCYFIILEFKYLLLLFNASLSVIITIYFTYFTITTT